MSQTLLQAGPPDQALSFHTNDKKVQKMTSKPGLHDGTLDGGGVGEQRALLPNQSFHGVAQPLTVDARVLDSAEAGLASGQWYRDDATSVITMTLLALTTVSVPGAPPRLTDK
jgi:hypothetical protein